MVRAMAPERSQLATLVADIADSRRDEVDVVHRSELEHGRGQLSQREPDLAVVSLNI
jgi:hypothetical protein